MEQYQDYEPTTVDNNEKFSATLCSQEAIELNLAIKSICYSEEDAMVTCDDSNNQNTSNKDPVEVIEILDDEDSVSEIISSPIEQSSINYNNEIVNESFDQNRDLSGKYRVHKSDIFKELKKISNSATSVTDKILEIETKNSWGRNMFKKHINTKQNEMIMNVLKEWNIWNKKAIYRQDPLAYKCYICTEAWWHLGPFKEHMKDHEEPKLMIYLETNFHECSIAASTSDKKPKIKVEFSLHSNCWKCGNDYDYHNSTIYKGYACKHCKRKFYTCTDLNKHFSVCAEHKKSILSQYVVVLGQVFKCHICQLLYVSRKEIEDHYINSHSVRSDLPMPTSNYICSFCDQYFSEIPLHHCPKIRYDLQYFVCKFCEKKFPSKLLLDIHDGNCVKNYSCRICNEILRAQCMEMRHLATMHSDNFQLVHKCNLCEEIILLHNEASIEQHRLVYHKPMCHNLDFIEQVVVPKNCIKLQKMTKIYRVNWHDEDTQKNNTKKPKANNLKKYYEELEYIPINEIYGSYCNDQNNEINNVQRNMQLNNIDDNDTMDLTEGNAQNNEINNIQRNIELNNIDDSDNTASSMDNAQTVNVKEEFEDFEEITIENEILKEYSGVAKDEEHTYENILSKVFGKKGMTMEEEVNEENETDLIEPSDSASVPSSSATNSCKKCGFFGSLSQYFNHLQNCMFSYHCTKCNQYFETMKDYVMHYMLHGHAKNYCPKCKTSLNLDDSFLSHIQCHVRENYSKLSDSELSYENYKCKACNGIVKVELLFTHWETHYLELKPDKSLKAEIKMILTQDDVEKIIKKLTANLQSDSKNCWLCQTEFNSIYNTKGHFIEHLLSNALKDFGTNGHCLKCPICEKSLKKYVHFRQHMRNHVHLYVYECNMCARSYSCEHNLMKHRKNHKSQSCAVCAKKFHSETYLLKHEKIHKSEGPFRCSCCSKNFIDVKKYRRHCRYTKWLTKKNSILQKLNTPPSDDVTKAFRRTRSTAAIAETSDGKKRKVSCKN